MRELGRRGIRRKKEEKGPGRIKEGKEKRHLSTEILLLSNLQL